MKNTDFSLFLFLRNLYGSKLHYPGCNEHRANQSCILILQVSSLGRADFPPTWQQRARVLLDYQQHVLNLSQLFPVSCHGHCYQKIWLLLQEDLGTQIQKRSAFISLTTCWICSCCCCFLCLHWRFTISNHNKFALFSLNQAALSNNVQDVRVPGI